ncbi:aldehyde dehydrogenase family protein [Streptomyces sp. PTM05]|uniref:Aldehyde dehydrogenase family protein n=1 Tax=Streptantibioticus parmotrematis TaxID=2873249 RepID=A0ABS7QQW2_9ACTN|nr:aldehyde dehydrogenase family protein [Streptantibioticus parmotrematis]MBY8884760.1 aldehyde dehydrogenase family protein [Streptantibioticus parmotrematis]
MTTTPATRHPDPGPGLDALVTRLTRGERGWARTTISERCDLLRAVCAAAGDIADRWVATAARIKQLDDSSPLVGEEWLSGPYALITYCQALQATLRRLETGADVLAGTRITAAPGGRLAVQVLPHDRYDKLLLGGFHAEVWTTPGITEPQLRAAAGLGQRTPGQTGGVALVLGAGNIFSIPPLDVLYQLYAANRTAVLKLNPTSDPLADIYRTVFKPLADRDLVEIVTGGPETGQALAHHRSIRAVHMTGSEATHDAIVWGTGHQAIAAKSTGKPTLDKPMTSELGGVSPIIVLPGPWTAADLRYQAEHIATMRLHNSGCNCIAGQILILSSDWDQRDAFLTAVRQALKAAPARPAWYPGCTARVNAACTLHPTAEKPGGTPERTLFAGLDLTDPNETAFTTEYFGPVLGVAELPGTGTAFLDAAVTAANRRLRGTLGANLIAHPKTLQELGDRLRAAIADLHYGTIAINAWTGVGYATPRATWGAFPGHTLNDVQSGIGIVHNALLLDHTERTVVTGPFRPAPRSLMHGTTSISPKPPWFVGNTTAARTGQLLTRFAAQPRWRALPALITCALRG